MAESLPAVVMTVPSCSGTSTTANISRLCDMTDPMSGSRLLGSGDFPKPTWQRCVHWALLICPSKMAQELGQSSGRSSLVFCECMTCNSYDKPPALSAIKHYTDYCQDRRNLIAFLFFPKKTQAK